MKHRETLLLFFFLLITTLVSGQGYCESGEKLFNQGKYEDAIKQYKACLIGQKTEITKTYIQLKIQDAEKCIKWRNEGQENMERKKWLTALEYFKNINKVNPFDKEAGKKMDLCVREGKIQNIQVVTEYKIDNIYVTDTISKAEYLIDTIRTIDTIVKVITITPPSIKLNFAPIGIKQIKNNQKLLGYTFTILQVATPTALGIFCNSRANWNYDQHKKQLAQNLTDHKNYYKNYKRYHRASYWSPVASFAVLYGVNIIFNYYFTDLKIQPQVLNDGMGHAGIGISTSYRF